MNEFLEGLLIASVSGTLISALLFLAKPFIKNKISHSSQYFSWYLVFIRMLLPFSVGGLFIGNLFSSQSASVLPPESSVLSGISSAVPPSGGAISQQQVSGFAHASYTSFLPNDWRTWIFALWLLGLIVLVSMNLTGYIAYRLQIKCSRRQIKDEKILALLKECCVEMKISQILPIYVSPSTDTPLLNGLFKCSIVLPDRSFTPEQLQHAFKHELTHYHRHDNLLKWLTVFSIGLNWFNPMIYLVSREAARQCELACDEAVTACFSKEDRIRYGKTLLAVASQSNHQPFALSATMSEDKRDLKERLEVLAKGRGKKRSFFAVVLFSIAAVITIGTLMVSCTESPASPVPLSTNVPAAPSSNYSNDVSSSVITNSNSNSNSNSDPNSNSNSNSNPDSNLNLNSDRAQIISEVSNMWKTKYSDISITNEWLGAVMGEDMHYFVLAGALKSNPQQGVVEVVTTQGDGTTIKSDQRYFCPNKNGKLTVAAIGAKDTTMILRDANGQRWNFNVYGGFNPQTPLH